MDLINKYLSEENKDTGWKAAATDRKDKYGNPVKTSNVAKSLARKAMKSAISDLKKGPEAGKRQVEEVDEERDPPFTPDKPKKNPGVVPGKYGVGPSVAKQLAKIGMKKQMDKKKQVTEAMDHANESVELDEVSAGLAKKVAQARDRSAVANELTPTQSRRLKMGDKGGDPDMNAAKALKSATKRGAKNVYEAETSKLYNYAFDKYVDITSGKNKKDKAKAPGYEKIARNAFKMGISRPMKKPNLPEEVELDEALRHEIAGAVAQFIGNKIDPVHGEIMRVHGREGYRQAATHIRKTISDVKDAVSGLHDRLHKQLRTGGLASEEVQQVDELKQRTLTSYVDKAEKDIKAKKDEFKAQGGQMRKKSQQDLDAKITKRYQGLFTAQRKAGLPQGFKEEVEELDEVTDIKFKTGAKSWLDNREKVTAIHKSLRDTHPDKVAKTFYGDSQSGLVKVKNKSHVDIVKQHIQKQGGTILDEGLKSKLAAIGVAATMAASPAAARVSDGGQSFAQQTAQQTTQPQSVKAPKEIPSKSYLQNVASGKSRSMMHPDTAKDLLKKHYSEEVDLISKYSNLGEGKYGSFRVRMTSGTFGGPKLPRRSYVPQGDKDPRTGLPLGFSNPPKSDKPENEKDKVKT